MCKNKPSLLYEEENPLSKTLHDGLLMPMLTILNLFGRSPFAPLESHMEKVTECVLLLTTLFEALEKKEYDGVEEIAKDICELEHNADMMKNDIRNHLPKSYFLPIDRGNLLKILTLQDSIADRAEDIAVLATLKRCEMPEAIKEEFKAFLEKNLEAFHGVRKIIKELHELLESSFGGIEAEKVRTMVDEVAFMEHEADLLQRELLKTLLSLEEEMSYTEFFFWQRIFETVGSIANLGYRVRATLELK